MVSVGSGERQAGAPTRPGPGKRLTLWRGDPGTGSVLGVVRHWSAVWGARDQSPKK